MEVVMEVLGVVDVLAVMRVEIEVLVVVEILGGGTNGNTGSSNQVNGGSNGVME